MRSVRQAVTISLLVALVATTVAEPPREVAGCDGESSTDKDQALAFWREIAFQARADLVLINGSRGEAMCLPKSQRWYLHVEGDGPARIKTLSSLGISFVIVYLKPARLVAIETANQRLARRSDAFTFDSGNEYLICELHDAELLKTAGFSIDETRVFRVLPRSLVDHMKTIEMEYAIRMGKGDVRLFQATVFHVKKTADGYQVVVKEQEYR